LERGQVRGGGGATKVRAELVPCTRGGEMALIPELQVPLEKVEPFRLQGMLKKRSGTFPFGLHDRHFVVAAQFLYEYESVGVREGLESGGG
jgi:hypothetical protein